MLAGGMAPLVVLVRVVLKPDRVEATQCSRRKLALKQVVAVGMTVMAEGEAEEVEQVLSEEGWLEAGEDRGQLPLEHGLETAPLPSA